MADYCDKTCSICHGLGFYSKATEDTPIDDPEFGKLYPCPNGLKLRWDPETGISQDEVASLNWDKFLKTNSFQQLQSAMISVLQRGYGWLYVYGNPGIGKTWAGKASVVQAHYKYHLNARYLTHARMINNLRASYDDDRGQVTYLNRLEAYGNIQYLVLDEIGRDRTSEFGVSALSELLDLRYIGATSRKTITVMLSNFPPGKVMDDYQKDRVEDRRFQVLQLQGESVRKVMTYEQASLLQDGEDWWKNL